MNTTEGPSTTAVGWSALSDGLGPATERDAFERVVMQWTGRDMAYHHANGTTGLEFAWFCWQTARDAERERCARICDGIGATHTGEARRLQGRHATHAAGRREGANECAAEIRRA